MDLIGPESIQEDQKGAPLIGHQNTARPRILRCLEMSESGIHEPESFILLLNLVSLQWAKWHFQSRNLDLIFLLSTPQLFNTSHITAFVVNDIAFWQAIIVAWMVKNLPAMQEISVRSLGQEEPWRRKWQPTPVFLPRESHGQRSLAGYSPWGHKELDMTKWLIHFQEYYSIFLARWR